ncbi:MAG: DUF4364 family protein, partial [Oscillospiraceae bacterium]|nr:DUF4364 family protein [Oscillospiraceae bacterium]
METPRIRIDEIDDICVLICYLIYSLGCPLSKSQLAEITSLEDAVNFFDFSNALDKVRGHLCAETDVDGETVYTNTPKGIKAARDLGASLPLSVREKMFSEAVRVYTRDAMKKKGSFLSVRYIKNADDSCTVGITVMDETTARQRYYLEIT